MPISIPTALLIGGGVAAAGGVASSVIGANAAGSAASAQANAANQASVLQTQLGQEGVNLQTEQLNAEMQNAYPWLLSGYGAEANLSSLLGLPVNGSYPISPEQFSAPGIPGVAPGTGSQVPLSTATQAPTVTLGPNGKPIFSPAAGGGQPSVAPSGTAPLSSLVNPKLGAPGSLLAPFPETFTPPTLAQAENYPGYEFQLQQGLNALQNSAAARGNLLTGQTQADVNNYAQGQAQSDYTNVYNQQLQQFQQAYNIYQQQQANTFNRLSALAGGGQTAASQLNSAGQAGVSGINNILLGTGAQVGSNLQNAGAARASGYVGSANAINGGIGSLSSLAYLPLINNYLGGSNGSVPNPTYDMYQQSGIGTAPLSSLLQAG